MTARDEMDAEMGVRAEGLAAAEFSEASWDPCWAAVAWKGIVTVTAIMAMAMAIVMAIATGAGEAAAAGMVFRWAPEAK